MFNRLLPLLNRAKPQQVAPVVPKPPKEHRVVDNRIETAVRIMRELRNDGFSDKELNELSLLVLLEQGLKYTTPGELCEQTSSSDSSSI